MTAGRLLRALARGSLVALVAVVAAFPAAAHAQQPEAERWREARNRMVEEHLRSPPVPVPAIRDESVLRAMRRVPRHLFVPAPYRAQAYANRPLPIGHGQTVSQPYVVAHMTELLELEPGDRVLEVGTGSGYQAAVLAEITEHVFTIEIIGELALAARRRLERLGYTSVRVRHGDGYRGWPEHARFDAIVVTAAPEEIPPPLIRQLARGGRLVLPKGREGATQRLTLVRKRSDGSVVTRELSPVRFVPFRRDTAGSSRDASR